MKPPESSIDQPALAAVCAKQGWRKTKSNFPTICFSSSYLQMAVEKSTSFHKKLPSVKYSETENIYCCFRESGHDYHGQLIRVHLDMEIFGLDCQKYLD